MLCPCNDGSDSSSSKSNGRRSRDRSTTDGYYHHEEEEDDDDTATSVSCGVLAGRACGYCLLNHYDIPIFLLSFLVLYLSVNRCCYCVVTVTIVCALLCLRFPILNAPLWSSLVVLYFHKDWNVNFGNIEVHWTRQ
jgi:hypothetical protein